MTCRVPESQVLHDGFEQHVLPVLAPLGFQEVPPDERVVGWTIVVALCPLPSGECRKVASAVGRTVPL